MVGYGSLFIADHSLVDDLVQDCFLTLWEKRQTIQLQQSVQSLLFVMLRNRCLNYLRDHKYIGSEEDLSIIRATDLQHLYELDFWGEERQSIEEELIEAIYTELQKLPEKRKLVFIKSKLEGLKNREIAEQLGISIKAVEKHLSQAKAQIREQLIEKYPMFSILILYLLK